MHQADAQHSTQTFDTKPFSQIQSIVISIPGEDAAIAKVRGYGGGMMIANAQRNRGTALLGTLRIGDSVDMHSWNGLQSLNQVRQQAGFVRNGSAVRGGKRFATRLGLRFAAVTQLSQVLRGRTDSRD